MTAGIALWARLIRRGAVWLACALAGYVAVEAWAYAHAYPDAAARAGLARLADSPAMRILQGEPRALDTTGGYVVWDGGWFVLAVLGTWALIVTSRLTRGEEDSDRIALVLAGPATARRTLRDQLTALWGGCALAGAAIAATLAVCGAGALGAGLFGLAIAAFGASAVAGTAMLAQVCATRRRALAAAGGVLALAYLLRMVANSGTGRGWLSWLTPFGWVDQVRPFAGDRPLALTPLAVVAIASARCALSLRERREVGAAWFGAESTRPPRRGGLSGPAAFAWRSARGVLLGWSLGLLGYALVLGSVVPAVTDIAATDPNTPSLLESIGLGATLTDRGVLAFLGPTLALAIALHACWRIGAARHEEAGGLAEVLLARPVTRTRWMGAHVLALLGGTVVLCGAGAAALWIGAVLGGAQVDALDALAVAFGPTPLVVFVIGAAVLVLGAAPRLAVVLPFAATAAAYLLSTLGPALDAPRALTALSPFEHLSRVPVESFDVSAATVLCALGVAMGVGGARLFARRDLVGA